MGVYVVHERPLVVTHTAATCSRASLVWLLCVLLTTVTPLLLVYRSSGLWITEAENREQADVRFKHQVLVITDTSSGPVVWSTNSAFNSLMGNYLRVPLIKSQEVDRNHDGIQEGLEFTLTLPLLSSEFIYGTTLLLIFDYRLHKMCEVVVEGLGLLQHSSAVPISAIYTRTDLQLHQRRPLPYSGMHTLYNTSVLPSSSTSAKDWKLQNILSNYWERNLTTHFGNSYTSVQTGESDSFTIDLSINYPEQKFSYIPGIWFIMKWAWVQYLSVMVVLAYGVSLVKKWIFQNQIVSTWVDFPKNKLL
ncbi:transmembrane protein 231 [Procambarus clarkii]|uniref:transmembrane protein 231 n=1 Tax=Procambarus clarkii TaxID=6728 RepID=UPI001E675EB6|nr:transmembrane protein 231-like [Procambarus clarkii]XP_045603972.1 transmembrane protein 231-like [Procambarus clarkii]